MHLVDPVAAGLVGAAEVVGSSTSMSCVPMRSAGLSAVLGSCGT